MADRRSLVRRALTALGLVEEPAPRSRFIPAPAPRRAPAIALRTSEVRRRHQAKRSVFNSAHISRLTADWLTSLLSADQELRGDLRLLRARSRQLVKDNPHARQFLRLLGTNVVGPHGIRLQARNRGANGELLKDLNAAIEAAFRDWGRPGTVTTDRRFSWVGLQRLVLETVATDGEFLARKRVMDPARNPYAFALQLLDADLLDETYNRGPDAAGNRISMGVEVDPEGAALAYYLWTAHPADNYGGHARERIRVAADEIVHVFLPFRVGQTRGVPWFTPVMLELRYLGGYFESEVVAARLAANKQGFITTTAAEGAFQEPAQGETSLLMDSEPGQLHQLAPGQQFTQWNPDHPTTAFDEFTGAMLRAIGAGIGASYAGLTGDLRSASYSSMRVGLLQERDGWMVMQGWFSESLHDPTYRDWLKWAGTAGMVPLPTYEFRRWAVCNWMPRGWPWVDPLKDVQASVLEVNSAFKTRTAICAERGLDFEDVVEQLAEEQALADDYGVTLKAQLPTAQEKDDDDQDAADAGADRGAHRAAAGVLPRRRAAARLAAL